MLTIPILYRISPLSNLFPDQADLSRVSCTVSPTMEPTTSSLQRQDALRETIKLLHADWTREHLLGFTPLNDAAILSSPLQQLHSIQFEASAQFDPLDITQFPCTAMVSSEAMVIPAFSKDGWNAGFMIEESYGLQPKNVIICPTGPTILRFLGNEVDGTFFGILQHSKADIVWHFRPTRSSSSCVVLAFPPKTLANLTRNGNPDFAALEIALHSSIFCESLKTCFSCRTNRDAQCSCILQLRRSKNPLDLEANVHNVTQIHLGQCFGSGFYETFSNGVSNRIISIGTERKSLRHAKHGSAKKLLNWAIGDALKTMPSNIHRAITAPLYHLSDIDSLDKNSTTRPNFSPQPASLNESCTFLDSPTTPALPMNEQRITYPEMCQSTTDLFWPLDVSLLPKNSKSEGSTGSSNYSSTNPLLMLPQVPSAQVPQVATTQFTKIAPAPTTSMALPSEMVSTTPSILREKRTVTELTDEEMKKTEHDLRAWKAYQRKIRNRESAARSNLARRQKRLELARRKQQSN